MDYEKNKSKKTNWLSQTFAKQAVWMTVVGLIIIAAIALVVKYTASADFFDQVGGPSSESNASANEVASGWGSGDWASTSNQNMSDYNGGWSDTTGWEDYYNDVLSFGDSTLPSAETAFFDNPNGGNGLFVDYGSNTAIDANGNTYTMNSNGLWANDETGAVFSPNNDTNTPSTPDEQALALQLKEQFGIDAEQVNIDPNTGDVTVATTAGDQEILTATDCPDLGYNFEPQKNKNDIRLASYLTKNKHRIYLVTTAAFSACRSDPAGGVQRNGEVVQPPPSQTAPVSTTLTVKDDNEGPYVEDNMTRRYLQSDPESNKLYYTTGFGQKVYVDYDENSGTVTVTGRHATYIDGGAVISEDRQSVTTQVLGSDGQWKTETVTRQEDGTFKLPNGMTGEIIDGNHLIVSGDVDMNAATTRPTIPQEGTTPESLRERAEEIVAAAAKMPTMDALVAAAKTDPVSASVPLPLPTNAAVGHLTVNSSGERVDDQGDTYKQVSNGVYMNTKTGIFYNENGNPVTAPGGAGSALELANKGLSGVTLNGQYGVINNGKFYSLEGAAYATQSMGNGQVGVVAKLPSGQTITFPTVSTGGGTAMPYMPRNSLFDAQTGRIMAIGQTILGAIGMMTNDPNNVFSKAAGYLGMVVQAGQDPAGAVWNFALSQASPQTRNQLMGAATIFGALMPNQQLPANVASVYQSFYQSLAQANGQPLSAYYDTATRRVTDAGAAAANSAQGLVTPASITPGLSYLTQTGAGEGSVPTVTPTAPPGTFSGTIEQILQKAYSFGVTAAGIIFLILFLVGSIQRLVASGDEKSVEAAQKLMLNASIGLVIVLSAWVIGRWAGALLKIPGF